MRLKLGTPSALFASVLLISNGLFLGWFTVAKTYSLAGVFVMAAFVTATGKNTFLRALLVGLLLGTAINIRLFYLVLVPVFLLYLIWQKAGIKSIVAYLLGGATLALPHLYYFLFHFESYWFSNVGYHLNRGYRPAHEDQELRFQAMYSLLGLENSASLDGVQFPALLISSVLATGIALCKNRKEFALPLGIAIPLALVYLTPTPTHIQYFATITPYLAMGSAFLFFSLMSWKRSIGILYAIGMIGVTLLPLPNILTRFTSTGIGVKAIGEHTLEAYHIPSIRLVGEKIDTFTKPNDIVLSQWPGFLLETKAQPFPGAENQFWVRAGHRLSEEKRRAVHVVSRNEFRDAVFDPRVKLVVLLQPRVQRFISRKNLKLAGFERVDAVGRIYIYARTSKTKTPTQTKSGVRELSDKKRYLHFQ